MTLKYDLLWRPLAAWEAMKGPDFDVGDAHGLIQLSRFFEPKVKEIISQASGLFIDVGSNFGLYSVMAARAGASVVAFEPSSETFSILVRNIYDHGLTERIRPIRAACWDREGPLHLSRNKQLALREVSDYGEDINGVTLDSFGFTPNLIKIDAERSTLKVLKGAEETIKRSYPYLVFEAQPEIDELPPVRTFLEELGYRLTRLDRVNWSASA